MRQGYTVTEKVVVKERVNVDAGSFSQTHSHGQSYGSYRDDEDRFASQRVVYEQRIVKYEEKIKMHLLEIDEINEECVMWKKRHLDKEEKCSELEKETRRLHMRIEDLEKDFEMDAENDKAMHHKLKKTEHHLRELDDKYHHLKEKYEAMMAEYEITKTWEVKFYDIEKKCKHWEDRHRETELIMIDYQDKCRGFEKDAGDCDRMRQEIEIFRSEIITWEERHRHTEEELFACRKEVKVWEDKFLHIEILAREWEDKCHSWEDRHRHLEEELVIVREEIHEWRGKYEHCDKEMHRWESEYMMMKSHIRELVEEIHRVREVAAMRIKVLFDKVRKFCELEKEIRCLFERMEGLCHIEDIVRDDIDCRDVMHAWREEHAFEKRHQFVEWVSKREVIVVKKEVHVDVDVVERRR